MSTSTVSSPVLDSTTGDSPPPLTPVLKQTQFWVMVATSVVSVLVALGVVGPDFSAKHEQVVNAIALLASVIGPGFYTLGRSIAQHGHQQAVAHVLVAKVNAAATVPLQPIEGYSVTLGGVAAGQSSGGGEAKETRGSGSSTSDPSGDSST